MNYLEIEQDDLTDSEMLDVIREKMLEGWALSEYKYDNGVRTWLFEKEEAKAPTRKEFIEMVEQIKKDTESRLLCVEYKEAHGE